MEKLQSTSTLDVLRAYQKISEVDNKLDLTIKTSDFFSNLFDREFDFYFKDSEHYNKLIYLNGNKSETVKNPQLDEFLSDLKEPVQLKKNDEFYLALNKKKRNGRNGMISIWPCLWDNCLFALIISDSTHILRESEVFDELRIEFARAIKLCGGLHQSKHTQLIEGLFRANDDIIIEVDEELHILNINKWSSQVSPEKLVGKYLPALLPTHEERERALVRMKKTLETGKPNTYDTVATDGNKFRYYRTTVIRTNLKDSKTRLICFVRVYSSSEEIHKEYGKVAKYYENIVNNSNSAILRVDLKGRIQFANRKAIDLFEFDYDELIGKTVLETIVQPIDSEGRDLKKMVEEAFTDPLNFGDSENENITKNGRKIIIHWSNYPLFDNEGNFTELISIGNDVTQIREGQKFLYEKSIVIDQMHNGVVRIDNFGKIVFSNPAAIKLFQLGSTIIGSNIYDFSLVSDDQKFQIDESAEGLTYRLSSPYFLEKIQLVSCTVSRFYNQQKETDGYILYLHDITKEIENENEIERLGSFIRYSNDFIGLSDVEGNILFLNDYAQQKFGSKKGISSFTIHDFIEPSYKSIFREGIIPDVLNKDSYSGEIQFVDVTTKKRVDVSVNIFKLKHNLKNKTQVLLGYVARDISESKKKNRLLKENELFLQQAQEVGNIGSWQLDLVSNTLTWSKQVYKILGLEQKVEASYETFMEFVHEDDRDWVNEAFLKHLSDQTPYDIVHRIVDSKGKIKYVREQAKTEKDEAGKPLRTLGTAMDVTIFKENELSLNEYKTRLENLVEIRTKELDITISKLKESEEKYRSISETVWDIISIYDEHFECQFISKAVNDILGYSQGEMMAMKSIDILHPEDFTNVMNVVQDAIKNKKVHIVYPSRFKHKNGQYVWLEHSIRFEFDQAGNFKRYISSSRNISDRIKSEETLKDLNIQLGVRNNAIDELTIQATVDESGIILDVNQQFLDITQYNKEELILSSFARLNSGFHDDQFFKQLWNTVNAGKIWRGEIKNKAKDGSFYWQLTTIIPYRSDNSNNTFHFFSLSTDITKQKERELELVKLKEEAETAMKVKEEFLSVMSHEIRTPLNSVIGLSQLLKKKRPRKDQKDLIDSLNLSADNLAHLVNDVLDYSKIEANKLTLHMSIFDFYKLLDDTYKIFAPMAQEKRLGLSLNITKDVPHFIESDKYRIKQVLNNLLSNAIKFTESGSVSLNTSLLKTTETSHEIILEVEDTGIGVEEKNVAKIFEAFEQIREKEPTNEGTGLGLAIVKQVCDILGGSISLESEIEKGSLFRVTIPVGKVEANTNRSLKKPNSDSKIDISNKKILYVEDVFSNQFVVQNIIEEYGGKCDIVPDGASAILICENVKYDLILMDIQLPGINGFETARKIRKIDLYNAKIPIIAFTADTSEKVYAQVANSGMNELIAKPLELSQIEFILKKYLNQVNRTHETEDVDLAYYRGIFKNNPKKLQSFFELIVEDLNRFIVQTNKPEVEKASIRQEMHRIEPILYHLKQKSLINEFNALRKSIEHDGKIDHHLSKIESLITRLTLLIRNATL